MLVRLLRVLLLLFATVGACVLSTGLPAAQAEATPRLRWERGTVYVENHAGPRWPVWEAAESLDNYSRLNLIVVSKCPSNSQCIKVYTRKNLPGPRVGLTGLSWGANSGRLFTATVVVERRWGGGVSQSRRKGLLCHELGHAVGLAHTSQRSSCMYPYADYAGSHANARDRSRLRALYGSGR